MSVALEERVGLVCVDDRARALWSGRLSEAGLAVRCMSAPDELPGIEVLIVQAETADQAQEMLPAVACREHSQTPVMVLLEHGDSNDRASLLEAGADDCLTCPVSTRELGAHLARLASMAELSRQTARHSAMIAREMAHARRVQEHILPLDPPPVDGLDIVAEYVPAADIGGDFFDIIDLGDQRTGFFMADVAGHGVGAALNTMVIKSQLVIWARPGITVAETLAMLNNYLHNLTGLDYATAVYAVLDRRTRDLEYTVAGHPNPLLVRPGKSVRMLETYTSHGDRAGVHVGLPLGLFDDGVYVTETVRLEAGDRVLMYTDGLVEWRDDGGGMLGVEGLRDLVDQSRDMSLADQTAWLLRQMRTGLPDELPADDVNILGFELLP